MEEKFLIDTNIIIYYLDNKIPKSQLELMRRIFETSFNISTITNIEVLGWHKITNDEKIKTELFLSNSSVIYLEKQIEQKSTQIKRNYSIATPDAIIAASAILNGLTLVTRNEDDFKKIKDLKIYNPFKIK